MPRVTRVKKHTTEIGVIWLMTLGFATARPPTADVTETAESWDEYSSKISERTGGWEMVYAPGVNMPSPRVNAVPNRLQK